MGLLSSRVDLTRQTVSGNGIAVSRVHGDVSFQVLNARPYHPPLKLPARPACGELIGRGEECRNLAGLLKAGDHAVVLGPAGSGKTALAGEAVRSLVPDENPPLKSSPFPDGVLDLYVSKGRAEEIWTRLAEELGDTDAHLPARQRASNACRGRRLLLIIEGAEVADGKEGRCLLKKLFEVCDDRNQRLILTRDLKQALCKQRTVCVRERLSPEDAGRLLDKTLGYRLEASLRQKLLDRLQGHPLAISWAAGQIASSGEAVQQLFSDWNHLGILDVADPEDPAHTLRWLFQRSALLLDAGARTLLAAAGLMAYTSFRQGAMTAILGDERQASAGLGRLVQLGLLRRVEPEGPEGPDGWIFIHVLAYQFARRDGRGVSADRRRQLAGWLQEQLAHAARLGNMADALQHARAFLETDADRVHWPLAAFCLYDIVARANALGELAAVDSILHMVEEWMDGLPRERAAEEFWRRERSVLLDLLGDLHKARGDEAGALRSYSESQVIKEMLARMDPRNAHLQRDLSVIHIKVGDLRVAQRDWASALCSYYRSRAISETLVRAEPGNVEWQRDLSAIHSRVGDVQVAGKHLERALRSYSKSKDICAKLAGSDPRNARWQRDLAVSYIKMGDLQWARDELDEALCSYSESKEICEKLARSDPRNTKWQRDLAVSYSKVGDLQRARDELDEALRSYFESKAILEKLASADPTNAGWQHDLSVSHGKIGNLLCARDDLELALRSYSTSKAICETLLSTDLRTPTG